MLVIELTCWFAVAASSGFLGFVLGYTERYRE